MSLTTHAHSDLAFTLTKHYFGGLVASVIKALFNYDQASLRLLKLSLTNHKLSDIKKSLLILVKYQLVDYVKTVKNSIQQYEYSVVPHRIFSFFRIPRYIQRFGEDLQEEQRKITRIMITSLAERGLISREGLLQMTISKLTQDQIKYDAENMATVVSDLIVQLSFKRYVVRTSNEICLNIERFDRQHRDDLVVDTIYSYYNKEKRVKLICKTMLDLSFKNTAPDSAVTAPIPITELLASLPPQEFTGNDQLDRYLSKLASESNNRFFLANGTHPNKGPMYSLNLGLAIDYLVKEHLSSRVTTKFGPKCCRVFRVLLLRGPLLLKQIEEFIMLPARDVREYSYMLIKEGLIRNRQVPKTPDNAPGKSVFIMSVDLDQVVFNAIDICCVSISNLLMRYEHEMELNKPLLDRSEAVRKLLETSDGGSGEPKDDWNQYFNSHEISQLNRINYTLDKILLAKAQVDETLFLFHSWINIRQSLQVDILT